MKNNKLIISIFLVLILITLGIFYGSKIYYLNYYNIQNDINFHTYCNFINSLIGKNEKIVINKTNDFNGDYIQYKNIKIKNKFKEFELVDAINNKYILKDSAGNVKAMFQIIVDDNYVNKFDSLEGVSSKKISNGVQLKKYMDTNKIKNDIDLLNFIKSNYNNKKNIFNKTSEMRDYYTLNLLTFNAFSVYDDIVFIEGDYNGYILNVHNENYDTKEVHLYTYSDDKQYGLVFMNTDYFTVEYIQDIVRTLQID